MGQSCKERIAALGTYLLFSIFSSCNCANRRSGRSSWAEAVPVNSSALGMLFSWPDSMLMPEPYWPGIMEMIQGFLKESEDFTLDLRGKHRKLVWACWFFPTGLKFGNSREQELFIWKHNSLVPGSNIPPPVCGIWEKLIWQGAGIHPKERYLPNICYTAEQQLSFQEGREMASLWTRLGKRARPLRSQIF